jgi:hypothetical protein
MLALVKIPAESILVLIRRFKKKRIIMKNINRIRYISFFCVLALLVSVNLNLRAQVFQSDNENKKDTILLKTNKLLPILNNFRFIPSDVIDNPFITSFVKTSVGVGAAIQLKSFIRDLQGNVLDTLSGNLSFVSMDILFQLALTDWLAVNGKFGGSARLGSNAYTILTSGISYGSGYKLGAKVKIWANDQMMLSGSVDYNSGTVFLYSIYDFVKRVIESNGIDSLSRDTLLEKDDIASAFISLNYAYAPTDWFGILAVSGWGLGNPFNGKDKGNARLGLAASIDFDNIKSIGFPIGVLASVKYNSFSESGENTTNVVTYGLRIGYTGHKDFDIGLENTYQSLNYKLSDEKIKTLLTAIKVRYYF